MEETLGILPYPQLLLTQSRSLARMKRKALIYAIRYKIIISL
jgi:hypothetical protein